MTEERKNFNYMPQGLNVHHTGEPSTVLRLGFLELGLLVMLAVWYPMCSHQDYEQALMKAEQARFDNEKALIRYRKTMNPQCRPKEKKP